MDFDSSGDQKAEIFKEYSDKTERFSYNSWNIIMR